MATNLALDPDLIERALKVSGEKTKKAAVTRALEEFITRRSQKRLVDLMGKLEWDESFDYKAERARVPPRPGFYRPSGSRIARRARRR